MKKSYIYLMLSLIALFSSCSKENPFEVIVETEHGQVRKSALGIDVRDEEMVQTRADNEIKTDDFKISFFKNGSTTPKAVYRYGDMPDVVTLDKGKYIVKAEYGTDATAQWAPYYKGESEEFTIEPDKITDDIGEIICRLECVKVSILFAPILTQQMSEDSYVEVKVKDNESAALRFTKSHQQNAQSGYFHHEEGVSLVAVFDGYVEGVHTIKTESISEVKKGYHYKITFKLNTQESESKGDLTSGVSVNASVTVTDVERNVTVGEDEILDDNERPREEDPDDPNHPDTPADWEGPTVSAAAPLVIPGLSTVTPVDGKISLECSQDILVDDPNVTVILRFTSKIGFDEFYADIISPNLTEDELEGVGLAPHLDLVNPGGLEGALTGLGLPCNIGGEKNVEFNISKFMPMLAIFGENNHTFEIHAKDKNGECVVTLNLNFK